MTSGDGTLAPSAWLIVLNDGEAIAWVLDNSKMAFKAGVRHADLVRAGDDFVLYCTVQAFGPKGPKGSRVFAYGTFESAVAPALNSINGREYESEAGLVHIRSLPSLQGPDIRDFIDRLEFIPNKRHWASHVRSTIVPLGRHDFQLLMSAIEECGDTEGES